MARYALFIGISDYRDRFISNLRLAHRDAQNLHGLFRHRLGYGDNAILLPPNAGLRDFNRQFTAIGEKIQAGDSFILYFAGHGHQHGDNQYLLLPEANRYPIEVGDVIGEELLSLNNLKTKIERWPDSDCLFILDACRSPIAAELKRGDSARYQGTEVLQRMFTRDPARRAPRPGNKEPVAAAQAVVLNACSENDVAYEPAEGDAGVLCRALEAEIVASLEDGRPIAINADTPARLIGHIRHHWSDCPQTPWLSPAGSSFVLHGRQHEAAMRPADSEMPPAASHAFLDARQWRLACLDDTEDAYRRYIREAGPEGAHIDDAFKRIVELRAEALQAEEKAAREKTAQEEAARRNAEREARQALLRPGREFRDADWAPEMVVVPAGGFLMGSPDNERERSIYEGPQHRVVIAQPFAVGKYPVTYQEWQAVMGDNLSYFKEAGPRAPVERVSWEDAQKYIQRMNKKLGGKATYRLLSEAEWEYVCRAGTTTPFNTGTLISDDDANISAGKTTQVGSYAPNAFGLYDLHGNVWEWVEDVWHDNYTGAPADGRAWLVDGKQNSRVLRGGSCFCSSKRFRSASRNYITAGDGYGCFGFRLAKTLTPKRFISYQFGDLRSCPRCQAQLALFGVKKRFCLNCGTPLPVIALENKDVVQLEANKTARLELFRSGREFRDADWAPEMVVVSTGNFLMGSPDDEPHGPQHWVEIAQPIAVSKYPVSQQEWQALVEDDPIDLKGVGPHRYPVANVSWEEAQAYVQVLNRSLGVQGKYRLLSENEWKCLFLVETTNPAGGFAPNAFGLYDDPHGNKLEWVENVSHGDSTSVLTDGSAQVKSEYLGERVLRGGQRDKDLRISFSYTFDIPGANGSFRLAKTLVAETPTAVIPFAE